jgi:hypothetical protein
MNTKRHPDLVANAALIVPLLLVNTVATFGQTLWAHDHLTPKSHYWFIAAGFALAVESIGIYLAAEAHRALLAGDASLRLRLGSYAVGLLAGLLNYAHFAPSLKEPNASAIVFGVLSTLSPILWAIRSRSMSRDRLRALGLIDGRAVKFTAIQWVLFPRLSATAFRAAVWAGETNPAKARALVVKSPARTEATVTATVKSKPRPKPETSALPKPAAPALSKPAPLPALTSGPKQQRWPARQHPLWDDWLRARESAPWTPEDMVRETKGWSGETITLAAAATKIGRWEKVLAG